MDSTKSDCPTVTTTISYGTVKDDKKNYELKYKQALERARDLMTKQNPPAFNMDLISTVFPELKESEDERIKREILELVSIAGNGNQFEEIKDWLEKQVEPNPYSGMSFKYNGHIWGMCARDNGVEILFDGELKAFLSLEKSFIYPIYPKPELAHKSDIEAIKDNVGNNNKIEPKFHPGDWITDGYIYYKITEILDDRYIIESEYDKRGAILFEYENRYHLWTIQDAKDGDVLVDEDNNIGLYLEEKDDLYWHSCIYLGCDDYLKSSMGYHKRKNTKPATKEQCELLFQKMKQEGYEWRQEEKKLIKMKEPKFKVGDWVVKQDGENFWNGACVAQITNITDRGEHWFDSGSWLKAKDIRLWTVNDAKDGNVLVSGDIIFIFNNIHGVWIRCHCSLRKDGSFNDRNYDLMYAKDSKEVYPATKEQRDLLFSKMKQEGYEWDDENKKLSKQTLQITPKFCVGQVITDDNGTWYKITNIKCLDDWYYVVYDVCEDTTHHELCSIIDEKFRENRFVGEIKKMMGD